MFELKPLSKGGIDAALEKATRYRLLNEPWEAESICRDILAVDPDRRDALVTLLLATTDRFGDEVGTEVEEARALLPRLASEYERAYYAGIISERRGTASLAHGTLKSGPAVYDWLRDAMDWYQQAEEIRPPGNDDTLLRWNTCVRMMRRHPHIRPAPGPSSGEFTTEGASVRD